MVFLCLWDDSRGVSRSNSRKVPEERGGADKSSPRARRGPGRKGSDLGDVDGGQVLAAALLPDGENGPGGIDGGDAGHGVLHGGAADLEAVAVLLAPLGGGVDDQVNGAALDHVQNVGVGLGDTVDPLALDASLREGVAGAGGGIDLHAHLLEAPGDAYHLGLVLVLHGDNDPAAALGHLQTGALEGLQQGLGIGLGQTQHLAGGLHLGAQAGVHIGELLKGEHGGLDGEIAGLAVQAGAIAQVLSFSHGDG